jgi:hypothetical protein
MEDFSGFRKACTEHIRQDNLEREVLEGLQREVLHEDVCDTRSRSSNNSFKNGSKGQGLSSRCFEPSVSGSKRK